MEKQQAQVIREKLTAPLYAAGNKDTAATFLSGGYLQSGYGVAEGAAIDGSHAFSGNQGYYADGGQEIFLSGVRRMKEFFRRRQQRIGRPIRYVIKPGIGGQHTPFQGIASAFERLDGGSVKITGEYELGKDYRRSMEDEVRRLGIGWDQVVVIPSSKSGSTDETMLIFVQIFALLLEKVAYVMDVDGKRFAETVLDLLHEINFIDGVERKSEELFRGFSVAKVKDAAARCGISITVEKTRQILAVVLGNMFFETTDRPQASRLSAFIRNSGLDREFGDDAPGFGAMFDNVGGRWTADLHMMTFLAYYDLDASAYWQCRRQAISDIRRGEHLGVILGNKMLDEGVTDIALLLPDYLFWFGKSIEQNFNESIWQDGFINLIAVREKDWPSQKQRYVKKANRLMINLSRIKAAGSIKAANVFNIELDDFKGLAKQELAMLLARLFSTFYGMTNTVGTRLIARALSKAGLKAEAVDLNDPANPATRIIQQNLFLRQPYVELGKGLLEKKLKALQEARNARPQAVDEAEAFIKQQAGKAAVQSNIDKLKSLKLIKGKKELVSLVTKLKMITRESGRKLIPFIYLEADKFYSLRDYLVRKGEEWVMQGTSDQHISYQQVLAKPQRFLPLIISFVPEDFGYAYPAVGFAKGYLDGVPSHMVRDYFAEASFKALTELRQEAGGLGVFLRLPDTAQSLSLLKASF